MTLQSRTMNTAWALFLLLLLSSPNPFHWHLVSCHWSGLTYGCPAKQLIKPCSCNEITRGLEIVCEGVKLENLREVFENVQQTGQTLVYLKMKNNLMHTFPSYLLSKIDVRHLMAHKCSIEIVDSSAFSGLENKIESIDFSENKFNQIPSNALKNLTSLVSLNLNFNHINSIEQNAFAGLDSLLRLSLYGNKITYVHPQAFVGVGLNLTRVNLGGNGLSSIPSQSLRILKSIQRFQIHENQIQSLSQEDFSSLQSSDNLDVLNLAHNSIASLKENVFIELKMLNSIDFESNKISSVDDNAFNGIQETLEWLKLGENQLQEIPRQALQNLSKLRELDIRGNHIRVVHHDSFQSYGDKIKFLYLQKNKIEVIEVGAFDNLKSLEWLNLHSNRIKHIPGQVFEKILNNILILDIHDNPLSCSCQIRWYPEWIRLGGKHQMAHLSQDITCSMASNGSANQVLLTDIGQSLTCGTADHSLDALLLSLVSMLLIPLLQTLVFALNGST